MALVSSRIYPLVLPENTALPAVVFKRSFICQDTKEGYGISDSTIDITVLDTDFDRSLQICEAIHTALTSAAVAGIKRIMLVDGDEGFADETYIQNLTFRVKGI